MPDAAAKEQEAGTDEIATLYADVPRELHKRARDRAYEERRSLGSLVREAVEQYLARIEEPTKGKSKASA